MKKTKIFLAMGCAASLLLSGCGSLMPDLSKEQSAVIAEYAASLLLKYDKNYDSLLEAIQDDIEEDVSEEAPELLPQEPEESQEPDVSGNAKDEKDEEEPVFTTIQDFYGLEGLEFTYAGWSLTESYSADENTEVVLAFDAAEGNILAAAEFNVKNISEEPLDLNMLQLNPKIHLKVGEQVKWVQPTMLLNELITFSGTIKPGETVCLVLIAEYERDKVQPADSISILIRNESTNATIQLN